MTDSNDDFAGPVPLVFSKSFREGQVEPLPEVAFDALMAARCNAVVLVRAKGGGPTPFLVKVARAFKGVALFGKFELSERQNGPHWRAADLPVFLVMSGSGITTVPAAQELELVEHAWRCFKPASLAPALPEGSS